MLRFEWDLEKARANLAKHRVSFEEATEAFRDPFGLELFDDRFDYGEERLILIAMALDRLVRGLCRTRRSLPADLGVALNESGTGCLFRSARLICIRNRRSVR